MLSLFSRKGNASSSKTRQEERRKTLKIGTRKLILRREKVSVMMFMSKNIYKEHQTLEIVMLSLPFITGSSVCKYFHAKLDSRLRPNLLFNQSYISKWEMFYGFFTPSLNIKTFQRLIIVEEEKSIEFRMENT
ncbi:CLUMA_CG021472, isoform A [Clunio marinus]|uniref:CLUMA_CG021472, isoform A n=1 Tax=Clunio marinus TaxID=568069 RepID=A0A1J1J7U0_9DIPT|nr:CLUMA_CG021472, isoform A [Clunio marinus]